MIAFQASSTLVATRWPGAPSRVASGLLALGCGVSLASGFFDGQLARRDLSPSEVGFQMFLLGATGLLGGLGAVVAATKENGRLASTTPASARYAARAGA